METTNNIIPAFHDACALLCLGESHLVQEVLSQQSARYRPSQRVYLQAWIACETALLAPKQEAGWQEASALLLGEQITGLAMYRAQMPVLTIRGKRPWLFWLLGNLGVQLGCDEAPEHYTRALKLLDERRMNHPRLRIHVLSQQAGCVAQTGAFRAAQTQYELALALCLKEEKPHEALPEIYAGLSKMSKQQGHYEQARDYGKKALLVQKDEQQRAHLRCALGELYLEQRKLAEAQTAYNELLFSAKQAGDVFFQIESLIGLALVSLAEQHFLPARTSCTRALNTLKAGAHTPASLRGKLFLVCGKVAHLEASQVDEPQAQALQEEALACYIHALEYSKDPDIRTHLAQLLQDMLEHDAGAPSPIWHKAYRVLTHEMH